MASRKQSYCLHTLASAVRICLFVRLIAECAQIFVVSLAEFLCECFPVCFCFWCIVLCPFPRLFKLIGIVDVSLKTPSYEDCFRLSREKYET